jgi:hypothetical protein
MVDLLPRFLEYAGGPAAPSAPIQVSPFTAEATQIYLDLDKVKGLFDEWRDGDSISRGRDYASELLKGISALKPRIDNLRPSQRENSAGAFQRSVQDCLNSLLKELGRDLDNQKTIALVRKQKQGGYFQAKYHQVQQEALTMEAQDAFLHSLPHSHLDNEISGDTAENEDLGREAAALMNAYKSDVDQIQNVQSTMEVIASLSTALAEKVEEQAEIVETIMDNADHAIDDVEQAEKHIRAAIDSGTSYRFYVVCWFMFAGTSLLILDFIMPG